MNILYMGALLEHKIEDSGGQNVDDDLANFAYRLVLRDTWHEHPCGIVGDSTMHLPNIIIPELWWFNHY